MSHVMIDVIGSLVALGLGFGLGQIVAWRRAYVGGRPFLVPTAHPGPKTAKIAGALVIIVALASMVSGIATQNRVEQCNENFRSSLIARSDAAGEVFDIIINLQREIAATDPGPEGDDSRYQARQNFVYQMENLQKYRAMHPIPDVTCGEVE